MYIVYAAGKALSHLFSWFEEKLVLKIDRFVRTSHMKRRFYDFTNTHFAIQIPSLKKCVFFLILFYPMI